MGVEDGVDDGGPHASPPHADVSAGTSVATTVMQLTYGTVGGNTSDGIGDLTEAKMGDFDYRVTKVNISHEWISL